ncbi:septation protein SepH [Flexivirga oryzae]|uniref:DUF3071 domain-containing protein n=1 Tax=Flexivirga oryzae TaxID=1794944 RepID=A0A839NC05_9MICO|nr:septation protein SepH [Flexivirga oryzae]MBB2892251.1 hypothetical protein [Flexivirga oryzae]
MRELRLIGVDDGGEHLLLAGTEDTDERLRLPIDDALRTAVRKVRHRPSTDVGSVAVPDELRPRDVQALLRAGVSVDDVAERAGWTTEKVLRYEGPIRAEREHIAGVARGLPVSGTAAGRTDSTFGQRVEHRLDGRGVAADDIVWDAWRGADGAWSVICSFPAGGRQRQAAWHFDVRGRTLDPSDDEARWLGEDENAGDPLSRPAPEASVYDVEAEGGLDGKRTTPVRRVRGGRTSATAIPSHPTTATGPAAAADPADGPVDLVAAMRERSKSRKRKGRSAAEHTFPEDAAPRQQLDTTGEAPPVGSHPRPDELDDTEAPAKPSVEELGHDPVTGTADLFADLEPEAASDEPEPEATPDEAEPEATTDEAEPEPDDEAVTDENADATAEVPAEETSANVSEQPETEEPEAVAEARDEATVPDRPTTARKGRPSVPSWDDIMFGRRPGRG